MVNAIPPEDHFFHAHFASDDSSSVWDAERNDRQMVDLRLTGRPNYQGTDSTSSGFIRAKYDRYYTPA
jgi:hypothetical protein